MSGKMTKSSQARKPPWWRPASLKYRGIGPKTTKRYRAQLSLFFLHLDSLELQMPSAYRDLDKVVAAYIDSMYQNGEPIGYAGDLLSGLSRWVPGSRGRLPTARLWFKNWNREVVRKRALPIPVKFLKGLAGIALALKRVDLAALLLTGFVCMLRPSELFGMRKQDVLFSPLGGSAIITLRQTKTSGPNTEEAVLYDRVAVGALQAACAGLGPEDRLYTRGARFCSAKTFAG